MTKSKEKTGSRAKSPRWEDEFARMSESVPTQKGAAHFGDRLRWARALRRIGMQDLADSAGLSKQTLLTYEREGETARAEPRLTDGERLATLLNVSAPWLVFGEGKPEPAKEWQR